MSVVAPTVPSTAHLVRAAVAENSATPAAPLAALAADRIARRDATSNPGMLLEELWSPGILMRMFRDVPGVPMLLRYRAKRRFIRMTIISSMR
jgi:hypothetical protein